MTEFEFLNKLGSRIRELRLQKSMRQHELAISCNFEKASMSRIEAGKTNVTIITLMKISHALEVDIVEFFR